MLCTQTTGVVLLVCCHCLIQVTSTHRPSEQATSMSPERQHTDGYYLDTLMDILPGNKEDTVEEPAVLECPGENIISTKYKCNVNNQWVDCTRKHCCPDYTYIAGRCVHKDKNPCSLNLCEQRCTVYLQRIICTCFDGYKFSPENQRNGITPVCIDVNECSDENGDCEHACVNEVGTYRCECNPGYELRADNRTCEPEEITAQDGGEALAARRDRCFANCDTVSRLHAKVKSLQAKVLELSTAIRLSSYASGPPGPAGPPGEPGPVGPRGFPGQDGVGGVVDATGNPVAGEDYTYSVMDSFVPLDGDSSGYCRCQRGPIGPPGAAGSQGPKGNEGSRGPRGMKGDRGNMDFVLLLLADMRHDIVQIQKRIFVNEKPPEFDFKAEVNKQRGKMKHRLQKQNRLLHAFTAPVIENNGSIIQVSNNETIKGEEVEELREDSVQINLDSPKGEIEEDYYDYELD